MRIAKMFALVVGLGFVGSFLTACQGGGCGCPNPCQTSCNTCETQCNTCESPCAAPCGSPCGVPSGGTYVAPSGGAYVAPSGGGTYSK
jgi:hypothetical protein